MALEKIEIENFTAFDHLELTFSPGLNVLIGENGTGKTHLMKLGYYVYLQTNARIFDLQNNQEEKTTKAKDLINIFLPYQDNVERLIRHTKKQSVVFVSVGNQKLRFNIQRTVIMAHSLVDDVELFKDTNKTKEIQTIYIPPKDALTNAPGFRSLYEKREIHFESIYKDILDSAFLPFLRESNLTKAQQNMLAMLEKHMGGKVLVRGETFFLDNGKDEPLEFDLLAEGLRKLGLLWLLIRNGELDEGTVLFWDEPESNLNPKLMGVIVQVLIELQRMKVQVILATHNFVLLKEFDLRLEKKDEILFHSLYKDKETKEIRASSTADYLQIEPNPIDEAFDSLYDRGIKRSLGEAAE